MGLMNSPDIFRHGEIAKKIKKEINQFKFIFHNHNRKETNTINYQNL